MGMNTWCHSISVTFKFWCWVPRESVLRGSSAHKATRLRTAQNLKVTLIEWLLKLTLLEWHQVFRPLVLKKNRFTTSKYKVIMAHGISQEKLDEIGLEPEQVNGRFVDKAHNNRAYHYGLGVQLLFCSFYSQIRLQSKFLLNKSSFTIKLLLYT